MGTLYVAATPIGNLEDITFRTVEALRAADFIACEDTRLTARLCQRYKIETPRLSLHQHSSDEALHRIVDRLCAGESGVYVTDAGTPGVCDPGNKLVKAALVRGVKVSPLPGPSALTALLSVSGEDTQRFLFLGYPPHKKGRETFFRKISRSEEPVVYYDSVHRVLKNWRLLSEFSPQAHLVVGREMTKIYEEFVRGSISEIIEYFENDPSKLKGEFAILVL